MKIDHKKLARIDGWFARTDFEICKTILLSQSGMASAHRSVVEIGVHHGKSFVVLGAYSGESKLYAVDIFDDQDKNRDRSGHGNKEVFLDNLNAFNIHASRVVIDSRSSSNVDAEDILSTVGSARFFHIDGAHHYAAVKNDLGLAVSVLDAEGVIAIDDVFRPEWPEVSMATLGSGTLESAGFVCFAIGFNKSYFCKKSLVEKYQEALRASSFLSFFLRKTYRQEDRPLLIYQHYPLPEWSFPTFFRWALSIYMPELFVYLMPLVKRMRQFVAHLIKR